MMFIQPDKTYDLLGKPWDEIQKLVDDIIIKILEHYGFTSEYVMTHPDEFSIVHDPGLWLRDVTDTFVLMHKGTTIGTYAIHSYCDIDGMWLTYRVSYILGGDS